jgi:hypothetical protein
MAKKKSKVFDCVEMKTRIQARLQAEWAGLSNEQVRERIQQRLAESDDPLAQWWRRVGESESRSPVPCRREKAADAFGPADKP